MFFKKSPIKVYLQGLPKHVGIIAVPEDFSNLDVLVKNMQKAVQTLVKMKVPVISFYILPLDCKRDVGEFNDYLSILMQEMYNWSFIDEHQVKVSVLGHWYDLPERVVEPIKKCVENTKDYDRFFVNFCINYSGQAELVSAMRLIAKKIELEKLDAEEVDEELVKEHLSTSYFIPPGVIIVTGSKPQLDGFLLWDSPKANISIVEKPWRKFSVVDLVNAVRKYQKVR